MATEFDAYTPSSGEVKLIIDAINDVRTSTRGLDDKLGDLRDDIFRRLDDGNRKMDSHSQVISGLLDRETERNGSIQTLMSDYLLRKQSEFGAQKFAEGRHSVLDRVMGVGKAVLKRVEKPLLWAGAFTVMALGSSLFVNISRAMADSFGVLWLW